MFASWAGMVVCEGLAVDDTKNHLTYFVRVDWHLPGRELSEMSEVAVVFAHVCIMGWHG